MKQRQLAQQPDRYCDKTNSTWGTAADSSNSPKKSLYQRYWEFKNGRNKQIPDEELVKYTGMTRDKITEWGKMTLGVAGSEDVKDV